MFTVPIPVLYEDASIIAIAKPAGVVVNRAESVSGATIQDWMEQKFSVFNRRADQFSSQLEENFGKRSGLVHRLDKETSGVLLLAKNPSAMANLLTQFKQRQIRKLYTALAVGRLEPKTGAMRLPLARDPKNRQKYRVWLGGRDAETGYQVLSYYLDAGGKEYSLVELYPKTGRTHQLRVHLAHLKHPVVADAIYGGRSSQRQRSWCPRHFLHAAKLEFCHPVTGHKLSVTAPLPADLTRALRELIHV